MATVFLTVALLLGRWGIASAHTALISSDPAAGSHLTTAPGRVRLVFSEPLEATLARITLHSSDGRTIVLKVAGDPKDVEALIAPVDSLGTGAYRLAWRVVSADGHPVDGSFVFSVGTTTAEAPAEASGSEAETVAWGPTVVGAPIISATLRGLALGSLMALAGLLLFISWRTASAPPVPAALRVVRTLAVITPVLLAAHAGAWLMNASPDQSLSSDWVSTALATGVGQVELWRFGLSLLALWATVIARRPRFALVFAAGALAVSGATGHAAAIDPLIATPAKSLHLLAGAAWIGGLLWLIIRRLGYDATPNDVTRVSSVALGAVLVVTISGAVQTYLFLPSLLDLVRSAYGIVTLAKVAGLLVLIAFGAHHRFRMVPALAGDPRSLHRFAGTLRRETIVMAVVILLGGLLAYVPPPEAPHMHSMSMPMPADSADHSSSPTSPP